MAKPAPFPHTYTVKLEDRRLAAAPRAPIAVGAPPQFGGSDEVWSPEELLVGAALECLLLASRPAEGFEAVFEPTG